MTVGGFEVSKSYNVYFKAADYNMSPAVQITTHVAPPADVPITVSTPTVTLTEIFCTLSGSSLPATIALYSDNISANHQPYTDFTYNSSTGDLRIYNLGVNYQATINISSPGFIIPDINATTATATVTTGDSQLTASWAPSANYTYALEAMLLDGTTVALLDNLTSSPQTLDSLTNGTSYFLYITVTPSDGTPAVRGFVGDFIPHVSLATPTINSINAGDSSVSFICRYDSNAESYKVAVYQGSAHIKDDTFVKEELITASYNGYPLIGHSVTGLTNGLTYTLQVTAIAAPNQTVYTDSTTVTTTATPISPPTAPVIALTASDVSSISISIQQPPSSTSVLSYAVSYKGSTASKYATIRNIAAGTTSYVIHNLTADTYTVKVNAVHVLLNSADSNEIIGIVTAAAQYGASAATGANAAAAGATTPDQKAAAKKAIDTVLKTVAPSNATPTVGGVPPAVQGGVVSGTTAKLLAPNSTLNAMQNPSPPFALAVTDGQTVSLTAEATAADGFYIPMAVNEHVILTDSTGGNATEIKHIEVGGVQQVQVTDVGSGNVKTVPLGKAVMIAGAMHFITGFGSVLTSVAQAPLLSVPVVGSTSVTYTINPNQAAGTDLTDVYYKLYVYAADGVTPVGQPTQTTGTASTLTSVTFTGLTAGQTYKFAAAITTSDGSGVGPLSALQDPYSAPAPAPGPAPVCFFADAPVLTPRGYRPIGQIKVGDAVTTADGRTVRVTRVFMKRYVANAATLPYKIPKGTLGATRDLPISSNHEVAVPGRVLTYYNLELEDWVRDHMVVAGVTVESLAPIRRIEMTKAEFQAFVAQRYPTVELQGRLCRLTCVTEGGSVKCPLFMK